MVGCTMTATRSGGVPMGVALLTSCDEVTRVSIRASQDENLSGITKAAAARSTARITRKIKIQGAEAALSTSWADEYTGRL